MAGLNVESTYTFSWLICSVAPEELCREVQSGLQLQYAVLCGHVCMSVWVLTSVWHVDSYWVYNNTSLDKNKNNYGTWNIDSEIDTFDCFHQSLAKSKKANLEHLFQWKPWLVAVIRWSLLTNPPPPPTRYACPPPPTDCHNPTPCCGAGGSLWGISKVCSQEGFCNVIKTAKILTLT